MSAPPIDDGLSQPNPSATDDIIVRRGQDAMERKRRSYEDWIDIGEALEVGRTDSMRAFAPERCTRSPAKPRQR